MRAALLAVAAALAACAPAVTAGPRAAARYGAPAPDGAASRRGDHTGTSRAHGAPSTGAAAAARLAPARWVGSLAAGGGGRRAPLTLQLGGDAAGGVRGAVEFVVTPRASTFAPRGASVAHVAVPVAHGRYMAGRLELDTEPYYDAGCECTVTASLRATVRGDTLAGTVVTRGAVTAAEVRGRWLAVRTSAAAAAAPSDGVAAAAAVRP